MAERKLYPPIIEGTIPAFYGTTLVVPFSMNRAVSKADIRGLSLKIKTIQTNTFVANVSTDDYDMTQAKFNISNAKLTPGQYYKVQLAYVASDDFSTVGYYSTVGVVKYYGETGPLIYIDGLSNKKNNLFTGYYVGIFNHKTEPMEKVAQYRFIITHNDINDVFYDSGWILHNTANDVNSLQSSDIFKYSDELDSEESYYLQYKVLTSNKMECSTPRYKVVQKNSVGSSLNLVFKAETNYDNGYNLLSLKSLSNTGENATLTGAFEISRRNMRRPRHWETIFVFILQNEVATKTYWKDFTVQHGETYQYAIRQFNEAGVYTDRVLSNEVFTDFEDAFLFDGQRQLKIRFNPKVSSFKNDILESKTDTIGSKYPFIFRNGHVNYKEFPVSGLISYFGDEQELFLTNEEIGIVDITDWKRDFTASKRELPSNAKTTSLTNHNIAAERKFKLEALEWLTNGKPKLFRSPTEGNYIVRLLNTSLTPIDTVGRMLHTFNSTAYEIADNIYENLVNYGFIDNELSAKEKERSYYRTVPLGYQGHMGDPNYMPIVSGKNPLYIPDDFGYIELLRDPYAPKNKLKALSIYLDDMVSGDSVWVNDKKVIIGNTGQYILEKAENIYSVKIRMIPEGEGEKVVWRNAVSDKIDATIAAEQAVVNLKDWSEEEKESYMEEFSAKIHAQYEPIIEDINNASLYDHNYILNDYEGLFTYKYNDIYANSFDLIAGQTLIDYPCTQITGIAPNENVLNQIVDNVRTEIINILQIQAELKQIEDIYTWKKTSYWVDNNGKLKDTRRINQNQFKQLFSFDKVKTPGASKGSTWDDIINKRYNALNEDVYIYKIHPIFQRENYNFDADIVDGYAELLSPWELAELKENVIEVLNKYNLTLQQVSDFVRYQNNDDIIQFEVPAQYKNYVIDKYGEDKTEWNIKELIDYIRFYSTIIQSGRSEEDTDFRILEKYFGKKDFNYEDSNINIITVYDPSGDEQQKPVMYKNEGYYVDATYYRVNPYEEYNKFYTFDDEDLYLIYKNGGYEVVKGYSSKIYINTGISEGVVYYDGELYAPDGEVLQPYIDLAQTGSFKTTLIPQITDIYVGDGVVLNLSYQVREIQYSLENTDSELKEKRQNWLDAVNDYTSLYYTKIEDTNSDEYNFNDEEWIEDRLGDYGTMINISNNCRQIIDDCEEEYLECLKNKIAEYKEERGIE